MVADTDAPSFRSVKGFIVERHTLGEYHTIYTEGSSNIMHPSHKLYACSSGPSRFFSSATSSSSCCRFLRSALSSETAVARS